jgi:UDP-glucuronate 4-epimerase
MLTGKRIVVAGATGQVGLPVAHALAKDNEVWAVARFTDAAARESLEAAGARCVAADLVDGDLAGVPDDAEYLVNFSVMRTNDWGRDLDGNAGGTSRLMERCRTARAVLHCSSTAVYQPAGDHAFNEDDPLGDNHRVWAFISTYSICKIAAEAMARECARRLQLPTTIARLNVPYGDNGGWPAMHLEMLLAGSPIPIHEGCANLFNPIHEDDVVAMIERLLNVASVPATVVNWGGDDVVGIEEWCRYLGGLVGVEPSFVTTDQTIQSVSVDLTRMHELVGHAQVPWREGFRRMVASRHPELTLTIEPSVGGGAAMKLDQRNEPFHEPPRDQIPGISAMHVAAMEVSDADEVWVGAGMNQLMLRTIGRKSGKEHRVALPYWIDPGGQHVVVASFSGAPQHPAWYLNLTDRDANGEVLVREQHDSYWAAPQILEGDDYRATWDALIADRPYYNEYQIRTSRRIPLVRLVRRRPA